MKFLFKSPAIPLKPFVRHYWYFKINITEVPFKQVSFPYGAFELICYLQNPNSMSWTGTEVHFSEPDIFYAGQLTRSFTMSFDKPCVCVGASLYPWVGNLLYNIPANEFTNELLPLDRLESSNNLYEQLMSCENINGLFDQLDKYLLKRLLSKQVDLLICDLAKQIIREPVRDTIRQNFPTINLSRRRIEQRFKENTGLTMGSFARKARFQKAVDLMESQVPANMLTEIGLHAGYYDQSHFISDFKEFSGLSPKQFIRQKSALKDFLKKLVLVEKP